MRINFNVPVNTTSYGYTASFFTRNAVEQNHDVRLIPISSVQPEKKFENVVNQILNNEEPFHPKAPCLKLWHQNQLFPFYGTGTAFGFPIFELEGFNDEEKFSLQCPDQLIVCSEWARNVIKREVGRDAKVVPLGYDESVFKPSQFINTQDKTIFGNFGKFEYRKGHDLLADAFAAAFPHDQDVGLVMMPSNPFLTQAELNKWISKYEHLGNRLHLVPRLDTQEKVYTIMEQVHCGVFPSRAEGWNLEALELLACGRHLIITDCTGHTEFCNEDNALLIKMRSGSEQAFDGKFFDGRGDWNRFGDSEFEQLVEHMRYIHKLRKEGSLKLNQIGVESVKDFTWSKSTQKLMKVLGNE